MLLCSQWWGGIKQSVLSVREKLGGSKGVCQGVKMGGNLAGQTLTRGRESGQIPIIISCLTYQEFLGVLSFCNHICVRLPFSTVVCVLDTSVSVLCYNTHVQLSSHPLYC